MNAGFQCGARSLHCIAFSDAIAGPTEFIFIVNSVKIINIPLSSSRICLIALSFQLFIAFTERKKKVPFSMAIGNGELMHDCFPKYFRMGTARMKQDDF